MRHDKFVAVHTLEKRAASRNALGREADCLIGAPRAMIVREKADPEPVGVGLDENPIDYGGEEQPAMALSGRDDCDALDQRHALNRSPLAKDRKADRGRAVDTDKIGMAAVDKASR